MRRLFGLVFAVAVACSSTGSDGVEADDCIRLRDHSVDLRLTSAPRPRGLSKEDLERHRSVLISAAGDRYVEDCMKNRSRAELRCALEADTLDRLQACLPQPANE